ncbi:MAG TPA: hypothetical protein VIK71_04390 [Flavobacteriales bacterium]
MKKQIVYDIAVVLLLLVVFFLSGYHEIINSLPRGLHFIRQTDSLSFTDNYYLNGYPFFEPHVFNLASHEGRAACEFPILYYLSAKLFGIFGYHYWIPRGLNLIVFSTGILSFNALSKRITGQFFLSLISTLILVSSTIVLYYGANFLVDIAALGLVLIGLNLHHYGSVNGKTISLWGAYVSFILGALLKVTFAIVPIALIICLLLEKLYPQTFHFHASNKGNARLNFLLFGLLILLVGGWYLYSKYYNSTYGDTYFLTSIVPYWALDTTQREEVFEAITNYWRTRYYYPQVVQLLVLGILTSIVFHKKLSAYILRLFIIGFLGLMCYLVLFFGQFKDHDYYFLPFVPFCGMILILIIQLVGLLEKKWIWVSKIVLTGLCVASLHYSIGRLKERYTDNVDKFEYPRYDLFNADEVLTSKGISRGARFLVVGDNTRNGTLFFLKRAGYTFGTLESLLGSQFSSQIQGECDYLVINQALTSMEGELDFEIEPFLQLGQWSFYKKLN